MTDPEWLEWTAHHGTLFALRGDANKEMIALWRSSLGHLSLVDLREASNELIATGGKFPNEHVAALLKIVSERVRQRAVAWESKDRSFACAICWDRGLVDVPHPSCVANGDLIEGNFGGQRYFASIVVYCSCNKGGHKHQRLSDLLSEKKGRKPPMPGTLIAYERETCTHWKDLMEEMKVQQQTRRAARMAFAASKRPRQGVEKRFALIGESIAKITPAVALAKAKAAEDDVPWDSF